MSGRRPGAAPRSGASTPARGGPGEIWPVPPERAARPVAHVLSRGRRTRLRPLPASVATNHAARPATSNIATDPPFRYRFRVRVLFASTHGAGHFGPLVPFMDACVRSGHDVLVTGPPTLDPRGYPFRVGASPPADVLRAMWDAMPRQPPAQGEVITVGTIFAGLNVEAMLPPTEELIADWKPDLVVREVNEYASAIAAARAGLRHVRVGISQAFAEEGGLAFAAPALEDVEAGDRSRDRGVTVRHLLSRELRPCAVSRSALPRPCRGCRAEAASGLVAGRRSPARLHDVRERRRRLSLGGGRVSQGARGARRAPGPRATHRRPRARVGRGALERPRGAVGAPGGRPRARGARSLPRRLGHDPRHSRRRAAASSSRSSPTSPSMRRGPGSSAPAWSPRSRLWDARSSGCWPTTRTPRRPGEDRSRDADTSAG